MSLVTRLRAAIARRGPCCSSSSIASTVIWLMGSRNPYTPAGYVGYLTQGAFFGQSTVLRRAARADIGRTRAGCSTCSNISVTPYTYTEEFVGD